MSSSRQRRKKLLVLTSTFPRWPNDADPPFVYELCCRLSREFRIHVLAPRSPGSRPEEDLDGMHVTRYPYFFRRWENLAYQGGILAKLRENRLRAALIPLFLLGQLAATLRMLHRENYDCIHAHWLLPQGLVAAVAQILVKNPPPLTVTAHGSDLFALQGVVFNWLRKKVLQTATAVSVVSEAMRETLCGSIPGNREVPVIPMGVDLSNCFVPPESRPDEFLLLYVGRLMESKGLGTLLMAMPDILEAYPSAQLLIVGSGPDKEKFRQLAARLKIQNQVDFTGALEKKRLPAVYRKAAVVVFPSMRAEGFGLVPVEALGCGCAVVASDLPAVREVIRDGENGLLVSPGHRAQLAAAVKKLLADPSLRNRLGTAGRRFVASRFDWNITAARYANLFRAVMKNKDVPYSNR